MSALPTFTREQLQAMPEAELNELHRLMAELQRTTDREKLYSYYPDEGPLRRELYKKHVEFFSLGAIHKERLFCAANRSGKSVAGAYEVTCHLTGYYPPWWTGKRFDRAINVMIAGDTAKTARDILQFKMLGPPGEFGTGMIPAANLVKTTPKPGIPDAVETIYVKHAKGRQSRCQIKSYDQGREAFQGTEQHVVWFDEEVSQPLYVEGLMRTMTTNGICLLTFTPILGYTELVQSFLESADYGVATDPVLSALRG